MDNTSPLHEKKRATIACACKACELTLADGRAVLHLLCGCEDCRQALQWGYKNGGVEPDPLSRLYYMRSDILAAKGREKMVVVKLRDAGLSKRIYCADCYSILGAGHPAYKDNVFLNFPKHCINDGDLTAPLSLMLFMHDCPQNMNFIPAADVPVFQSLRDPGERNRFYSIEAVANAWRKPTEPPEGTTFGALIESLGPSLVLNLEKGKNLLS
jgi:hypothetical protein